MIVIIIIRQIECCFESPSGVNADQFLAKPETTDLVRLTSSAL